MGTAAEQDSGVTAAEGEQEQQRQVDPEAAALDKVEEATPKKPAVGLLPPDVLQRIELRRQQSAVAARLAGTNWGQQLDVQTRMAVADWAQRHNIDATTEIDVLGGRIYLNSRFYLNRLAVLVERGVIAYAYADHIHADTRLQQMAEEYRGEPEGLAAEREIKRRKFLRIERNVPEEAPAAVIFRVKLRHMDDEVSGCKWTGLKRMKQTRNGPKVADPVGDEFPVETAESRAARRAMRHLVNHVPEVAQWIEAATDDAEATITAKISDSRERSKSEIEAQQRNKDPRALAAGDYPTPETEEARKQREAGQRNVPERQAVPTESPYADGDSKDPKQQSLLQ